MKLFYKLYGIAILGALTFSANAESLPTPTMLFPTGTTCTLDDVKNFILDWGEDIDFVDPLSTTADLYEGFSLQQAASLYGVEFDDEITSFQTVKIDCPEGSAFETEELCIYLFSYDPEGGSGFKTRAMQSSGITPLGMAIVDNMPTGDIFPYEMSGKYTLHIPAGLVCRKGDPSVQNEDFDYTFNVMDYSYAAPTWTPEPSNISDVDYTPEELSAVRVTFETATSIEFANGKSGITYTAGVYGSTPNALSEDCVEIDGNALVLDLSNLTSGSWEISIPTGYLILDGTLASTEDKASYNVGVFSAVAEFAYDADSSVITVTWEDVTAVTVDDLTGIYLAGATEANGDFNLPLSTDEVSVEGASLVVDLSALTPAELPDGSYRLILAENSLVLTANGKEWSNTTSYFNFTFVNPNEEPGTDEPGTDEPGTDEPGEGGDTDGIAGIEADANGLFTVYTLQGNKVMTGTDLNGLGKGLYIINGKKVILK